MSTGNNVSDLCIGTKHQIEIERSLSNWKRKSKIESLLVIVI